MHPAGARSNPAVVGAAPLAAVVVIPVPVAVSMAMPVPRIGGRDPGARPAPPSPTLRRQEPPLRSWRMSSSHPRLRPRFSPTCWRLYRFFRRRSSWPATALAKLPVLNTLGQTGVTLAVFGNRAPHSPECAANCPARCSDSARSSVPRKDPVGQRATGDRDDPPPLWALRVFPLGVSPHRLGLRPVYRSTLVQQELAMLFAPGFVFGPGLGRC